MAVLAMTMVLAGCAKTNLSIDYNITAGNSLYLPADGESVDLTTGAATTFQWSPSIAADNGWISYEILFATENGTFDDNSPFLPAQMNGGSTYLSATAKDLNNVAKQLGIGIGETGTVKWTIRASKGLNGVVYGESRKLTLATLNTMDPLPTSLSMKGTGAESASEATNFIQVGSDGAQAEEGIFSAFTKLQAGDVMVSDDLGRYYLLNSNGTISYSATEVSTSISLDGIYWLKVDFSGMTWSADKISKVELYAAAWSNGMHTAKEEMTYAGGGKWELLGYDNATSDNEAGDTRHRFNMHMADGTTWYLGTASSFPGDYTTEYMKVAFFTSDGVGNADWDKTYNFKSTDCGRALDCYLYLNADNEAGSCWHEYIFK